MIIVIICSLVLLLGISVYINVNLFRKNEKMEETIDEQFKIMVNARNLIKESSERVKAIDKNGAFSSDDEIGWFFKSVKAIQDILSEMIETQPLIDPKTLKGPYNPK